MASIEIKNESLIVHIEGIDKLLAMRSTIAVPLTHVRGVILRPNIYELMFMEMGATFRGVQVPGRLVAGTVVMQDGAGYVFADVHDPVRAISIELDHDAYKRLIIEVSHESPEEAKGRIEAAMVARSRL